MKKTTQIVSCLAFCFVFLCLGSVRAQTTGGSSAGDCAVSVDMVLIGEVCILGGLGVRTGEENLNWDVVENPGDIELVEFGLTNPLSTIIIATKPTKLSWVDFQFFIDYSLFNKLSEDDDLRGDSITSSLLSDAQIQQYKELGILTVDPGNPANYQQAPGWQYGADLAYQYVTIGFLLKAPWSYFLKPFLGVGLTNESIDVDIHLKKDETKVSGFEAYTNITEIVPIIGIELINVEGFLFNNSNLTVGKVTQIRYATNKLKGKNGIEIDFDREKVQIEYFVWSFTF
jgi:hypothetical protein